MGARKIVGIVFFIVGVAALVVFLFADILGYGSPGFGIRQIIGTSAGAAAVVVGLVFFIDQEIELPCHPGLGE
ncbi:hypothetical protein ES705_21839 [subsurface metagenome]